MSAEIRMVETDWDRLRSHLLSDGSEHAAILIGGTARIVGASVICVREVVLLGDNDLLEGSSDLHLEVSPIVLARVLKQARESGESIVVCHSHPFPGRVAPSPIDRATEAEFCGRVARMRLENRPVGSLILGPDGVSARVFVEESPTPADVRVVGEHVSKFSSITNAQVSSSLYDRQVLLWGEVGQSILSQATVAVVGLGGTGSHAALQLAHLGVGKLILIDDDVLEVSNLSRIVGACSDDIGSYKVDAMERAVHRVRQDLDVLVIRKSVLEVDPGSLVFTDLVMCCTDGHGSRSLLNELAYQYLVPVIELGIEVQPGAVTSRAGGGVRMIGPGRSCLQCMDILDAGLVREEFLSASDREKEAELGYLRGHNVNAPSVVALNGVVSSMAVMEACNLLVGVFGASPNRIVYRANARAVSTVQSEIDSGCYVCGDSGVKALGSSRRLPHREEPRAS